MNARWAVRLPSGGDGSAADLRLEPGIEILEHEDGLWLRGAECDERLEARLRTLPGAVRYEVLPDGQLRPKGKRLPHGRLPAGLWHALKSWAQVELQSWRPEMAAFVGLRCPQWVVCAGLGLLSGMQPERPQSDVLRRC